MKISTRNFVYSSFNSLLIAVAIVIITAIATANAQDNLNVLNGLFTPTSAQRFFQVGRENFEQEVEIFIHPERYVTEDLLRIDPKLIKQMEETQPTSNFEPDSSRNGLYLDSEP